MPLAVLKCAVSKCASDTSDVVYRCYQKGGNCVCESCDSGAGEEASKLPFRKSNLYPDYYQNNFHYQTGALPNTLPPELFVLQPRAVRARVVGHEARAIVSMCDPIQMASVRFSTSACI